MPELNAMKQWIKGAWIFFLVFLPWCAVPAYAKAPPVIVVVGDSLTAGYGLAPQDAFPAKLQRHLKAMGKAVVVENAGVSGDTTGGGAARMAWSVGPSADAVILSLGANDALRGLPPEQTRDNLAQMLTSLRARKLPVLLAGMRAPPNMGPEYASDFDRIYPELAKEFKVLLYPFFLDGVAGEASLNQQDMLHPTAAGVDVMVARITPYVLELLSGL
ncbi:MAG: arylesterase [Pseudomonadota bacterium]